MVLPFSPISGSKDRESQRILGYVENLCWREGVSCRKVTKDSSVIYQAFIDAGNGQRLRSDLHGFAWAGRGARDSPRQRNEQGAYPLEIPVLSVARGAHGKIGVS